MRRRSRFTGISELPNRSKGRVLLAALLVASTAGSLSAQTNSGRNCPRQDMTVEQWNAGYRRHENLSTKAPQAIFCKLFQPYARDNLIEEPFRSAAGPALENFMRLYTRVGRSSYDDTGSAKLKQDYRNYTTYVAHQYLSRYRGWGVPGGTPPNWEEVLNELWVLNYGEGAVLPTEQKALRQLYLGDLSVFEALGCAQTGSRFSIRRPWDRWVEVLHRYRDLGPPAGTRAEAAAWHQELTRIEAAVSECAPRFGPS